MKIPPRERDQSEILLDQLEFLIGYHTGIGAPGKPVHKENCPDCERLEKIAALLLQPFR